MLPCLRGAKLILTTPGTLCHSQSHERIQRKLAREKRSARSPTSYKVRLSGEVGAQRYDTTPSVFFLGRPRSCIRRLEMVRFKNRYLLCAVEHDSNNKDLLQSVSSRAILSTLRESLLANFGDVGAGHAQPALAVKYWSPILGLALVRASRDHFRSVWASATLATRIDGLPETVAVRFRVIHVGGTIRSCQKSAAEYARQLVLDERDAGRDFQALRTAADGARRELDAMEQ